MNQKENMNQNATTQMQFRHEYKHYLNYADYLCIRNRLQCVMKKDSHVGSTGCYQIRSLYFDSMEDKALREKINGASNREKFRIRCYDFNFDFIRLEKKIKKGGLGYKVSAPLTYEQTEKIINGDTEWMKNSPQALIVELYEKMKTEGLRPKTIVDYTREPFVYSAGNVRVTLDYDIRTGLQNINLLDKNVPTIPASPGAYILEVKYDNFMPDMIRDIVQLRNREESAFSKYATCRTFG